MSSLNTTRSLPTPFFVLHHWQVWQESRHVEGHVVWTIDRDGTSAEVRVIVSREVIDDVTLSTLNPKEMNCQDASKIDEDFLFSVVHVFCYTPLKPFLFSTIFWT